MEYPRSSDAPFSSATTRTLNSMGPIPAQSASDSGREHARTISFFRRVRLSLYGVSSYPVPSFTMSMRFSTSASYLLTPISKSLS